MPFTPDGRFWFCGKCEDPYTCKHAEMMNTYVKPKYCQKCQRGFKKKKGQMRCQHLDPPDRGGNPAIGRGGIKLRRPKKNNEKEWLKIQILEDHGFGFEGYYCPKPCCGMYGGEVRHRRPQRFSELEDFLNRNGIVNTHKEYRDLLKRYRQQKV